MSLLRRLLRRHSPFWVSRFGMIHEGWMIYVGPWRTRVTFDRTGGPFPNGSTWCSGWCRTHPKRRPERDSNARPAA